MRTEALQAEFESRLLLKPGDAIAHCKHQGTIGITPYAISCDILNAAGALIGRALYTALQDQPLERITHGLIQTNTSGLTVRAVRWSTEGQ